MGRGPCAFRQEDLKRALKAARAGGLEVTRVEIITKDATIIMSTGKSVAQDDPAPLDRWLADNAHQT